MIAAAPAPPRPHARWRRAWDGADTWTRTRSVLIALWVLASLAAVAVGQHYSDYATLRAAVAAGDVRQVTVIDALRPGSTGYALVEVTWRDNGVEHLAEVWQIGSGTGAGAPTSAPLDGDHPHVHGDVGQQLRAL